MEISAKAGDLQPVKVNFDMPENLEALTEKFGAEAVYNAAVDSFVITIQAAMRRKMVDKKDKDGKVTVPASSAAEIQAYVAEWKPDSRTVVRQSAVDKALSAVKTMTPEQRAALLAQLQQAG